MRMTMRMILIAKRRKFFIFTPWNPTNCSAKSLTRKRPRKFPPTSIFPPPMIYKWAQPREGEGSGIENPLDRVEALYPKHRR